MRSKQSGFAPLEMILIIVIVGIIAFVAWRIVEVNGTVDQAASTIPADTVVPESSSAAITPTNTEDLVTLERQLDSSTIDDSATTDLDTQSVF